MKPITYPARPINGGRLELARPKQGEWGYEPKYNGWRALVHIPTGTMFNRQGSRLSIEKEFDVALDNLGGLYADNGCDGRSVPVPEWLDCEALERRHGIGRGTLIVLDFIGTALTYSERRSALAEWIDPMNELTFDPCGDNEVRRPPTYRWSDMNPAAYQVATWHALQKENERLGCDFFEGLVAKRCSSRYPIQLHSPDRECADWMKHRFI